MPADEVIEWFNNWQPAEQWSSISDLYWEDNDYPMLAAEVEHQRWISLLIHAVNNDNPIPHQFIGDEHHCNFGKWYDRIGKYRYGSFEAFTAIDNTHKKVHAIAAEIDHLMQSGETLKARDQLPNLIAQRDMIIEQLNKLALEVAHKERVYETELPN